MIIIVGVGNEFRRDDGAGPAVIKALRGQVDATLAVTDGEPVRLIELWADADLAIVIDAVRAEPADPGRIHELNLETVAQTSFRPAASSHALGLGEAVRLGEAVERLPRRLHVYAIEGQDFGFGPDLSKAVAAAIDAVAERVIDLLGETAESGGRPLHRLEGGRCKAGEHRG